MKLMIEIEKEDFETIVSKYDTFPAEMKRWGINAIKSGIPLPDNATNGDTSKRIKCREYKAESGE